MIYEAMGEGSSSKVQVCQVSLVIAGGYLKAFLNCGTHLKTIVLSRMV
jgi:hypothetical protein